MTRYNKTILIIEDDKSLLDLLSTKLQTSGFETISSENGRDGLTRAFDGKPDMIILDIILPHMDGITVLKHLRHDEWGKNVPVIVLTNFISKETVTAAEELGINDFLVKTDWHIEDLIKKVKFELNIHDDEQESLDSY